MNKNILENLRELYRQKDFYNFRLQFFRNMFFISQDDRIKILKIINNLTPEQLENKKVNNLLDEALNLGWKLAE